MTETLDLEKTEPIKLLENRRAHLIKWLRQGEEHVIKCENTIKEKKQEAIEILKELDELEKALNVLNAAPKEESEANG